ncbi:10078_t:CDS:1, partial [Ambispora gerdemannii]
MKTILLSFAVLAVYALNISALPAHVKSHPIKYHPTKPPIDDESGG